VLRNALQSPLTALQPGKPNLHAITSNGTMDEQLRIMCSLFEGLPRQGPGSDACTKKMFQMLPGLPESPEILDIGCGSGMQTLELARLCNTCRITAVDVYPPFLAALRENAERERVNRRIKTISASMDDLPFDDEMFDLIWAEGSIFIIGPENALPSWNRYLRPGGFIAFTEAVWLTDTPSAEVAAFWQKVCPDIKSVAGIRSIAEKAGYSVIADFVLPDSAWWEMYYNPLAARLGDLSERYHDNPEALGMIDMIREEMAIFREYSDEYGYVFFLLQKMPV
jgi:ubiquinone/menaquinone biosynthesis C-methylase UbiE